VLLVQHVPCRGRDLARTCKRRLHALLCNDALLPEPRTKLGNPEGQLARCTRHPGQGWHQHLPSLVARCATLYSRPPKQDRRGQTSNDMPSKPCELSDLQMLERTLAQACNPQATTLQHGQTEEDDPTLVTTLLLTCSPAWPCQLQQPRASNNTSNRARILVGIAGSTCWPYLAAPSIANTCKHKAGNCQSVQTSLDQSDGLTWQALHLQPPARVHILLVFESARG
jgi:hypothetical protein